jgi:glutathione S-transferase
VIPASPPCACIEAALRLKGVAYDRTVLPNVLHIPHQLLRFGVATVPTMRLDGEKLAGSRTIMRRIDERWPDPPLYARPGVEEAEAWGEATLQPPMRRIVWWAMSHCQAAMPSYVEGSGLPLPAAAVRLAAPLTAPLGALRNGSRDDAEVRAALDALPGHLDRIDGWVDAGVLGTEQPTAADLQIGPILALLRTFADLAPLIDAHPRAASLVERWFPAYPGHMPAGVFPTGWVPAPTAA